jgi:hypothetical protein
VIGVGRRGEWSQFQRQQETVFFFQRQQETVFFFQRKQKTVFFFQRQQETAFFFTMFASLLISTKLPAQNYAAMQLNI